VANYKTELTMLLMIYGFMDRFLSDRVRCLSLVFNLFSIVIYFILGNLWIKRFIIYLDIGVVNITREEIL
jgi:hypothetical protein